MNFIVTSYRVFKKKKKLINNQFENKFVLWLSTM